MRLGLPGRGPGLCRRDHAARVLVAARDRAPRSCSGPGSGPRSAGSRSTACCWSRTGAGVRAAQVRARRLVQVRGRRRSCPGFALGCPGAGRGPRLARRRVRTRGRDRGRRAAWVRVLLGGRGSVLVEGPPALLGAGFVLLLVLGAAGSGFVLGCLVLVQEPGPCPASCPRRRRRRDWGFARPAGVARGRDRAAQVRARRLVLVENRAVIVAGACRGRRPG